MQLVNINSTKDKHWHTMLDLYNTSFPDYERRSVSAHLKALESNLFHSKILIEKEELLGLFFYWQAEEFTYIEHIAVHSSMRGKNIGSKIIQTFLADNPNTLTILEIEPPIDPISIRRLKFYAHLGFQENSYPYIHPSYSKTGLAHPLQILSYPKPIDQFCFHTFCDFMKNEVLRYID